MAGRFKTDVLDRALERQRTEREKLRLAAKVRAQILEIADSREGMTESGPQLGLSFERA